MPQHISVVGSPPHDASHSGKEKLRTRFDLEVPGGQELSSRPLSELWVTGAPWGTLCWGCIQKRGRTPPAADGCWSPQGGTRRCPATCPSLLNAAPAQGAAGNPSRGTCDNHVIRASDFIFPRQKQLTRHLGDRKELGNEQTVGGFLLQGGKKTRNWQHANVMQSNMQTSPIMFESSTPEGFFSLRRCFDAILEDNFISFLES